MMILIAGGSGSGKSLLAEQICQKLAATPMYYLATMRIWDAECEKRVQKHRKQRAGKGFASIDVPEQLEHFASAFSTEGCILLECIGNLLANEQFGEEGETAVQRILTGITLLKEHSRHFVIVSNDVSADLPATSVEMQNYIQNIGTINCTIAKNADMVLEVCAGIPIVWKGNHIYDTLFA